MSPEPTPPSESPAEPGKREVAGLAATMTVIAMGLGYSITSGDPTILSANISKVRHGLGFDPSNASFLASLATLTLAAAVLGAGVLGDLYGLKRMYMSGLIGAICFGVLAAASPNVVVLMIARAGSGVSFAFMLGLSLAVINAVFPPGRRAGAISLYLAAGYGALVVQPLIGSELAQHFGWRTCFLVAPTLSSIALVLTWKFVPETARSSRRLDVVGLAFVAVALLGVIYGISRMQTGIKAASVVPLAVGLIAAACFVWWELRTDDPALDMRIFRSARFNGAVAAGATFNYLEGGATILFAYYLVTVRGQSPAVLGALIIPATLLAAAAATGAGRLMPRLGERTVLVSGLVILLVGMLMFSVLDLHTPIVVLGIAVALNAIGSAVVQTPQATIMMSTAPAGLGGAVASVKSAVGQASYSLGPAMFALVGFSLFYHDGAQKLVGTGITNEQARDALRVAQGAGGPASGSVLSPMQAQWVVSEAKQSMIDAIHSLGLIMAAVPAVAIVLAMVLLRQKGRTAAV